MTRPLRLLLVEDSADDADLVLREIRRAGFEPIVRRVQDAAGMGAALDERWDVVVSDYSLPGFDAFGALAIVRRRDPDLPFLIVSGTIADDTAVEAMRLGAQDYLMKSNLARLGPAIDRELRDAAVRRERRTATELVLRSEERFRRLIDAIDEIVYTVDGEEKLDGLFGRWFDGLPPGAHLGRTIAAALGSDHVEPHRRALSGERVVYEWTAPIARQTRHFQSVLSPLRTGDSITGLVGISRDVTDQRNIEEQLRLSDRMVSVGTLAAGIAHEINNPLTVVMANLEFARSERATQEGELSASLLDAHDAAKRVREIVRDVKIFTRTDEETTKGVDLRVVLDSAARIALNEIRHRAKVIREYGPARLVHGNEARLGQVFLNLLVNAAHAIDEGRAAANAITLVIHEMDGNRVAVEVRDTGTKPVGTGPRLGLSISQRIVAGFGGTIEVESEPGKGTTFRVILPVALVEEPVQRRPISTSLPARRARVVVIDDERSVLTATARILGPSHDVETFSSPLAALARLQSLPAVDVIFCDLMMPEMSGIELYAAVPPALAERVVFLTGGAFTDKSRAFLDAPGRLVLEKPFDPPQLLESVRFVASS